MITTAEQTEQVVIRFSPAKLVYLFLPFAILVGISVYINPDQWRHLDQTQHLIYGGVALIFLLGLIFMPSRYYLVLSPAGLTVHYIGSQRHYSWDEMRDFCAVRVIHLPFIPLGEKVVFDLVGHSPNRGTVQEVAGSLLGYEVSIANFYHIKTEVLVELLYQWQLEYGVVIE